MKQNAWARGILQDVGLRRLLSNAGRLLSANAVGSALSLGAMVLAARGLGPSGYGTLALVLVYSLVIQRLATFNSWQAVIKLGAEAEVNADREGLARLLTTCLFIDLVSAFVATSIAIGLAGPVVQILGWDTSVETPMRWYGLTLLFGIQGTPTGALRLFERFDLLGVVAVVGPAIRATGVAVCFATKQPLVSYVIVHGAAYVLAQASLLGAFLWVSRERIGGMWTGVYLRDTFGRFPELHRYLTSAYLNAILRALSREADELVVAIFATPASLGIFKLAKQFSRILPMVSDPLYQAILPELSRSHAGGDRARMLRMIRRSTAIVGTAAVAAWLGFIATGKLVIRLTAGAEFIDAYWVTVVYLFAVMVAVVAFSLNPLALAIGRPWSILRANAIATVAYFVGLAPLAMTLDVIGMAFAFLVYTSVWVGVMVVDLKGRLGEV